MKNYAGIQMSSFAAESIRNESPGGRGSGPQVVSVAECGRVLPDGVRGQDLVESMRHTNTVELIARSKGQGASLLRTSL